MGNCTGSLTSVDRTTPPPPKYEWKEIYLDLRNILKESYDFVDNLQKNFVSTNVYHYFTAD